MPIKSIVRISPVVWLSPVLLLVTLAFANLMSPWGDPSYPPALTAGSTALIFLVAPVCAACAAWEGGRLRRAGWSILPHVRSPLIVSLMAVFPILIMGIATITIMIVVGLARSGVATIPDFRIVGMAYAVIVAHTLLGFAIGIHVPTPLAVPTVLLLDYAWMALPNQYEPLWLRHLTGAWLLCCTIDTDVAPLAILGVYAVAGGLTGTAILLLRYPFSTFRIALATIPTFLGFGAGVLAVQGMSYAPVIPRDSADLVCSNGQPRMCVWPEQQERLDEVAAIAKNATERWREVGVSVPNEFTTWSDLSIGNRSFGFNMLSQRHNILNSLTFSMLPQLPQCAVDNTEPYYGYDAADLVRVWLLDIAEVPHEQMSEYSSEVLDVVSQIRELPEEQQVAWYERNLEAIRDCSVRPQAVPQL
jgi:hypothetical protein